MLVRQNLVEQVRHRTHGRKRTVSLVLVYLLEYWFQGLAARYVTFCKGHEMYVKYKKRTIAPVFETAYSLLSRADFFKVSYTKKHTMRTLLNSSRGTPRSGERSRLFDRGPGGLT